MNAPVLPNENEDPENVAGLGHNNPPAPVPYDEEALNVLTQKADQFIAATDVWNKMDVTTETLAGQLTDQIAGLRTSRKSVDDARKAAKAPHDAAGKAVQAAFVPLLTRYDDAIKKTLGKMQVWLNKKQEEEDLKRREAKEKARAQEEEARRLAMDAEKDGGIDAEIAAKKAAKDAEKAAKAAAKPVKARAASGSGAGRTLSTRTRKQVTVKNPRILFMHYQNDEAVLDVLSRLATREANAAGFSGDIPGVEIKTITTAA